MISKEEFEAGIKLHKANIIIRKEVAKSRLMDLHQALYKDHGFIFIQHLMREMNTVQLENVIGAIDHE